MSKSTALTNWHPASWQTRPAAQQPRYRDPVALERAVAAMLTREDADIPREDLDRLAHHLPCRRRYSFGRNVQRRYLHLQRSIGNGGS